MSNIEPNIDQNPPNKEDKELNEILWPSGYGGKPLSITVDDNRKILQKPYSLLKNELLAWSDKRVKEAVKALIAEECNKARIETMQKVRDRVSDNAILSQGKSVHLFDVLSIIDTLEKER